MSTLHEVLAVEGNLELQANKVRTDLMNTFEKKRHLFEEKRVVFQSNEEGAPAVVEAQSDIQSSILKELAWIAPHLAKSLDASFQVAEANTQARADLTLDDDSGTILVKGVPVTALLELEKRVAEVHLLVAAAPTLDPAKGFAADPDRGEGIFKAREVVKTRTKKTQKVVVLHPPTKEHPAQVTMVPEDAPVGTIQEQEWSGLITPAQKAELIERAEILLRSVRRARSRANETVVDQTRKIGNTLLKYVFKGEK